MLFGASIDDKEKNNCKLYIANTGIEYSKITKYLGVYVDESLKFDIHVNNLTAKLAKLIGWLGRLRKTLPTGLLHIIYNSYVLPNFDYACTIWGSVNANTKCIQRLQNRAARIICNNFDIINYRGIDFVRELQWLSISQLINYFLCVLVFNCIHGNAPRYLSDSIDMASHMHDRNTRLNMSSDVNVPLGRTHYMRSSIIYRGAVVWNALPNAVKDSGSLSAFRINLKRHIRKL